MPVGVTPSAICLLADSVYLCHEAILHWSNIQHASEELDKLKELVPTYERSVSSLLNYVRMNDSKISANPDTKEHIKRRAVQAVVIALGCCHRVFELLTPEWWLQPDLASRAESKVAALSAEVGRWTTAVDQGISALFDPTVVQQMVEPETDVDGAVIRDECLFIPDRAVGRPASFNLPSRCLQFAGRSHTLAKVHYQISPDPTSQGSSEPMFISALEGVGKTELAIEYAYRYWFGEHPVFWIRADTVSNMIIDFVALAGHLGLPVQDASKHDDVINDVKQWLSGNKDWLIIFDNADDIDALEQFLPTGEHQGRVLVTTCHYHVKSLRLLPLDIMSINEGLLLLLKRSRIDMSLQAEDLLQTGDELVQRMGGLPLALTQAGLYIDQEKCGLRQYALLYRESAAEVTAKQGLNRQHPHGVLTAMAITTDQTRIDHPLATDLMDMCSFLHPDAISVALIKHLVPSCDSAESFSDPASEVEKAVPELVRFSLLNRRRSVFDDEGHLEDVISIHRVVQLIVRSTMDKATDQRWAQTIVKGVLSYVDSLEPSQRRMELKTLLPQMQACADHVGSQVMRTAEALRLVQVYSQHLLDCGSFEEARKAIELALTVSSDEYGPSHVEYARSLGLKASLLCRQGKYTDAEPLCQRVLAVYEESLGSDHPDIVAPLSNLAEVYRDQGKRDEAEQLAQRAQAIQGK